MADRKILQLVFFPSFYAFANRVQYTLVTKLPSVSKSLKMSEYPLKIREYASDIAKYYINS